MKTALSPSCVVCLLYVGRQADQKVCAGSAVVGVTVNAIHFPLQKALMSFDIIARCNAIDDDK